MCKALELTIQSLVHNLKNQKAPDFIIDDQIQDMRSGDAVICDGCKEYRNCFPDVEGEVITGTDTCKRTAEVVELGGTRR